MLVGSADTADITGRPRLPRSATGATKISDGTFSTTYGNGGAMRIVRSGDNFGTYYYNQADTTWYQHGSNYAMSGLSGDPVWVGLFLASYNVDRGATGYFYATVINSGTPVVSADVKE